MPVITIILLIMLIALIPQIPVYIAIFYGEKVSMARTKLYVALIGKFFHDESFSVQFIPFKLYNLVEKEMTKDV